MATTVRILNSNSLEIGETGYLVTYDRSDFEIKRNGDNFRFIQHLDKKDPNTLKYYKDRGTYTYSDILNASGTAYGSADAAWAGITS